MRKFLLIGLLIVLLSSFVSAYGSGFYYTPTENQSSQTGNLAGYELVGWNMTYSGSSDYYSLLNLTFSIGCGGTHYIYISISNTSSTNVTGWTCTNSGTCDLTPRYNLSKGGVYNFSLYSDTTNCIPYNTGYADKTNNSMTFVKNSAKALSSNTGTRAFSWFMTSNVTYPPVYDYINISSPVPVTGSNFSTHLINFSLYANSSFDFTCYFYINSSYIESSPYSLGVNRLVFYNATLADGVYNYSIFCFQNNDSSQNESTSVNVFTIDSVKPSVVSNIQGQNVSLFGRFQVNVTDSHLRNVTVLSSCNYNYSNASVSSPFQLNITENTSVCVPGSYNTTVTAYDYFGNVNSSVFYWDLLYNAQFQVHAYSLLAGTALSGFNLTINDSRSFSTASSEINVSGVLNRSYSLVVDVPGYEYGYANVSLVQVYQDYNFSLYTTNSINVSISDESSGVLITSENITIRFFNVVSGESINVTDTGLLYRDSMVDGEYGVTFSGGTYGARTYTLTLNNRSHQVLNAFLALNTSSTIFTASDKDTLSSLSGVLSTMYRNIGGVWTPVESKYTDISGKVQFTYLTGQNYKFYFSRVNYDDYIFYLSPVLFSSYDVNMQKSTSQNASVDFDRIALIFSPKSFWDNASSTFNFIIQSPYGELLSYGYTLTYPCSIVSDCSGSASGVNSIGSQLSSSIFVNGSDSVDVVRLDYFYVTSLGGRRNFTEFLGIQLNYSGVTFASNKDKTFGLGLFDIVLILTIGSIIILGIASLIGQPVGGAVLVFLWFGYFVYQGVLPIWSVLISIFAGLLLIMLKGES